MISAEQFQEWKTHPVTRELFAELKKTRKAMLDKLSNGNTVGQISDETHGLTNRAIGNIEGIDQLLNISFDSELVFNEVDERSGY